MPFSPFQIQRATEGKDWFWYVDKSVTLELLETLTAEFLAILDKCPNRLKKIMNSSQHTDDRSKSSQGGSSSSSLSSSRAVTGGSSSSVPSSRSHDHNSHNKSGQSLLSFLALSRDIKIKFPFLHLVLNHRADLRTFVGPVL